MGFPEAGLSLLRAGSVSCDSTYAIFPVCEHSQLSGTHCSDVSPLVAYFAELWSTASSPAMDLLISVGERDWTPSSQGWWPLRESQPSLPSQASSIKCDLTFSKTASSWFWFWEPSSVLSFFSSWNHTSYKWPPSTWWSSVCAR